MSILYYLKAISKNISTIKSITNSFNFQILLIPVFFFLTLSIISCEQKSEYQQRLETELSKDIRVDSLFLGYYLGMPREEFYKHSWDLNSRQVVTGQQTVHYELNGLKSKASMEFYPQFKDDKIYQMPVEVHYDGWAPWNKELFSDSLMVEMKERYEDIYNADFFKSIHPESKKEAFIDIQGNRRISIFKRDDRIVSIEFLDLSAVQNNL